MINVFATVLVQQLTVAISLHVRLDVGTNERA